MNEYYVVYFYEKKDGTPTFASQIEKADKITPFQIKDWELWFSYEHDNLPCKIIGITKLDKDE